MSRRSHDTVVPVLLLFALLAAYFLFVVPPVLVDNGREGLVVNYDLHSYFFPRYWLGSEEIRAGRLPLWNPYEYGGIPLLATAQPAALYPPKVLLYALLDPEPAYFALLVLHYAMMAGGIVWFLREEGIGGAGLFAGAACWVFGGAVLVSNYHPVRIVCLVWTPLAFGLASRVANGGFRGVALPLLALTVTIQLLAGYPEATMDLGLMLACYLTVRALEGRLAIPLWKALACVGAAFALGAVAAGIQLVPLAELGGVAKRSTFAGAWAESSQLLTVASSPLVALPLRFGTPALTAAALGGVFPPLAGFAVAGAALRRARAPAACLLLCAVMTSGGFRLLRELPGFSMVRFPMVWTVVAPFFFAWCAALGTDVVARADPSAGPSRRRALLGVVAASAVTAAGYLIAVRTTPDPSAPGSIPTFAASYVSTGIGLALCLGALLGIAALSSSSLAGRTPRGAMWLATLTLAILSQFAAFPLGTAPGAFRPKYAAGLVASLHGHPDLVKGRTVAPIDLPYGYEIHDRLPSALGVEQSFLPWRWRRVVERLGLVFDYVNWKLVAQARGFWRAMNVEYFGPPTEKTALFVPEGSPAPPVLQGVSLVPDPLRMGEAWVNYAVHPVASEDEAFEYVMGDRFDPHREVVLEHATRETYPTASDEATKATAVTRSSPTSVEFDVALPKPGIFVVSESAYPGWVATVDGEEKPWFTADYVLRGLELSPGTHRVRYEYRPGSVAWGGALSGVGLVAIAITVFVSVKARGRGRT